MCSNRFILHAFLLVTATLGIVYVPLFRGTEAAARYEAVPLIQAGRSSGMPLVGIAVDPNRRDVFAIVGGPKKADAEAAFFIAWTGADGETYSTTFTPGSHLPDALRQLKNGELRTIHTFSPSPAGSARTASVPVATADEALRSLLAAAPTSDRTSATR